jgi:putative endonuclease|tara:strand:+ start:852 stop:1217 length:366 start_codon:yes stop_codon:yes gene_type:complete
MYNKQQGERGERIAAWYLTKKGYPLVKKHFTDRLGELDLVIMDQDQLVFVEVKYRMGENCGLPEESVNKQKKRRLRSAILSYLSKYPTDDFRIDIVAITEKKDLGTINIRYHKAVFDIYSV